MEKAGRLFAGVGLLGWWRQRQIIGGSEILRFGLLLAAYVILGVTKLGRVHRSKEASRLGFTAP